jgi:hypothetical protein
VTEAPTTPEGAQARISELTGNKDWSGKLLAGDATTVSEFQSLMELLVRDPTPSAESIAAASQRAADDKNLNSFLDGARARFPVSDEVASQIATARPVSKADHELGTQWLQQLASDPDRSAKLMRGDLETKRQFFHASVLAASNVTDGAPTYSAADLLRVGQNQPRDLRKEI